MEPLHRRARSHSARALIAALFLIPAPLVARSAPLPASAAESTPIAQELHARPASEPQWALVPPHRPQPPPVRKRSWPRNPVDYFILAELERAGLAPAAEAGPETLLRRVTLDLTGLPPSPAQARAFLADPSRQAYDRLVDLLLRSRAGAERRAQDWLDLARYADSNGYADDQARAIWPYRDWVIEAFAQNMPFDQFTIEQLAGDLLPGATPGQRIASAFHRNSPQAKGATYPVEEYRLKGVADRVNTTGTVWFGLTLACAECHDHKSDPITQRDYYSLFAIFNNIEHSGEGFAQDGPFLKAPSPTQAAAAAALDHQAAALREKIQKAGKTPAPGAAKHDGDLSLWKDQLAALGKQREELDRNIPNVPVMQELARPRETHIHRRGSFLTPGERVAPGAPAVFGLSPMEQPTNRLQLARWLVNGRHPLVARVAVNRLWQSCFGQGLVVTPGDFGRQGARPTHPALLDWLACELVDSGWDLRHVHQLIVTSATYRQSARANSAKRQRDPQNQLLAHAPRPRLPAEQIRDQCLAVAGLLVEEPGGKPVYPVQPAGYWEDRGLPGKWVAGNGSDLHRRSIYTYWRRMALHPALELLDAPPRTVCTVRRNIANVPTQALVTLNDPIFVEAAEALAARVLREIAKGDASRLEHAFRLALGRAPTAQERARFLDFLKQQRGPQRDDAAAWTTLAAVLLNLDEFLCRP